MTALEKYFVLAIAIWRLTHLISLEDGPFDLIIKLRKLLGSSFLGKLMDCFYCTSVWVGLAGAIYAGENPVQIIALTLYYSGAALLFEKITNKNFA
ncbi:MAG TPA: DUF1360 domain-containing protein [Cyclobacteriaceae bacterium]|jgi:hypothetical protein|nr:DUF1360 domain-containing protein [Cyclobacteriaceae bacterium]